METIIASCITGFVTLIVCLVTNKAAHDKTEALLVYRLGELEKKVDKHNDVIERTYHLEQETAVLKEKMKVANNRINDLENGDDGK
ncbi:MAG: hypothetical protein MJ117_11140 [Lachnospiraceae bacterium]|nr:hypothetical protein [Lachnospiraceae bacterium]